MLTIIAPDSNDTRCIIINVAIQMTRCSASYGKYCVLQNFMAKLSLAQMKYFDIL